MRKGIVWGILIAFITVGLVIMGYPRLLPEEKSIVAPSVNEQVLNSITLPWDKEAWPKAKLVCENFGNDDAELYITFLGANNKSGSGALTVLAQSVESRKIQKLDGFAAIKKGKRGTLLIESVSDTIRCKIEGLPYAASNAKNKFSLDGYDLISGVSTIALVPNLYKKPKKAKLFVYNPSDDQLNLDLKVYSNVGKLQKTQHISVKPRSRKNISLNKLSELHRTLKFIPTTEDSLYFALYSVSDEKGKTYAVKTSIPFSDGVVGASDGKLVVANTVDVPANFTFTVFTDAGKKYQGSRWVMPNAQTIINLSSYTKNLSDYNVLISQYSDIKPQNCFTDENGEKACEATAQRSFLTVDFYPRKKGSPLRVEPINIIEMDEHLFFESGDTSVPTIPVRCFKYGNVKDSDKDGLCDHEEKAYFTKIKVADSDGDGINDGEELLGHLSDPLSSDGDGDGYSDAEEIAVYSKTYDPADFPGAPDYSTIEGLKHVVNTDSNYSLNLKGLNAGFEINKVTDRFFFRNFIEQLIYGRGHSLGARIYPHLCEGISICLGNANGDTSSLQSVVKSCFDRFRDAISDVSDIQGEGCKFCETTFRGGGTGIPCTGKENIRIMLHSGSLGGFQFGQIAGVSHSGGLIDIGFSNANGSVTRPGTICHEISHQFGVKDIYNNGRMSGWACSMHNPTRNCPSYMDQMSLKIHAVAERYGSSYGDVVNHIETCKCADGKEGFRINYRDTVSECVPEPTRKRCADEPDCKANTTGESEGGFCDYCKGKGTPAFNPDNREEYACCEDKDAQFFNGGCCSKVVHYGSETICCDESSDPRCLDCPEDKPYPTYKADDLEQYQCCSEVNSTICNTQCCNAECIAHNGQEYCCNKGEEIFGDKCCAPKNQNHIDGSCCDGEYCNGKCCQDGQLCNARTGMCYYEESMCKTRGDFFYADSSFQKQCCLTKDVKGKDNGSFLCSKGSVLARATNGYYYNYPIQDCCQKGEICGENNEGCIKNPCSEDQVLCDAKNGVCCEKDHCDQIEKKCTEGIWCGRKGESCGEGKTCDKSRNYCYQTYCKGTRYNFGSDDYNEYNMGCCEGNLCPRYYRIKDKYNRIWQKQLQSCCKKDQQCGPISYGNVCVGGGDDDDDENVNPSPNPSKNPYGCVEGEFPCYVDNDGIEMFVCCRNGIDVGCELTKVTKEPRCVKGPSNQQ